MSQRVDPPIVDLPAGLLRQVSLLRSSAFFVDPSGPGTNHEKRDLFLVMCGAKPVSHASSGHWEGTTVGRHTIADDPVMVGEFLSSTGLKFELSSFDGHATDAVVTLDETLRREYREAEARGDVSAVGRLFGYPGSAVAAFSIGPSALLSPSEQDERAAEAGISPDIVGFCLSRANWAEELATARRWQELAIAAGLADDDWVLRTAA
jgi:hypothetical protein